MTNQPLPLSEKFLYLFLTVAASSMYFFSALGITANLTRLPSPTTSWIVGAAFFLIFPYLWLSYVAKAAENRFETRAWEIGLIVGILGGAWWLWLFESGRTA